MAETLKMTEAELDAVRLNAMLNGVDLSSIASDDEDDFEIEIIDDEKSSKKKGAGKKKAEKETKRAEFVPNLPQYEKLATGKFINITFNEHDIHYKEQLWSIPSRMVRYEIELLRLPKPCADASDFMNNKSEIEKQKAKSGEVRYYRIVTYENVLHKISMIGYIKAKANANGNISFTPCLFEKLLKDNNVNTQKVKKNINNILKELIL